MSVTITRLPSGLYKIQQFNKPDLVGGAASTVVALVTILFSDEANGK